LLDRDNRVSVGTGVRNITVVEVPLEYEIGVIDLHLVVCVVRNVVVSTPIVDFILAFEYRGKENSPEELVPEDVDGSTVGDRVVVLVNEPILCGEVVIIGLEFLETNFSVEFTAREE
jgi:hypothetical protein